MGAGKSLPIDTGGTAKPLRMKGILPNIRAAIAIAGNGLVEEEDPENHAAKKPR